MSTNKYEKPDHYTQAAKKAGYPARSVYKLEEIDRKNGIIKPGCTVLDVGAAPGSWSLYCQRRMKTRGKIIAVDLEKITDSVLSGADNVTLIRGDITDAEIIGQLADSAPFDCILSDAAPKTTGNRSVDSSRSFVLVDNILKQILPLLKTGGNIVVKIFQGGDEQDLLHQLRARFGKVKPLKPKASRNNSFEVFFVGIGKLSSSSFV